MDNKYRLYFDSGTSNTRAYLLDKDFNVRRELKRNFGSRDSAIAGSNEVLVNGICDMYFEILADSALTGKDILEVYASGMVTSPYGLHEVPHLEVPLSVKQFSEKLYCYREATRLDRDIWLVPGLKTKNEDFSFVGNMRGEEIEVIGALDELSRRGIHNAAVILPGSHTHVAYIRNDTVVDILSNFTGELFHALKTETILSPILEKVPSALDEEMIRLGVENIERFGFNRAIYLCHAMRIMDKFTPEQRFSYCEAVINGGVGQALNYYCKNVWQDCDTVVLVSDAFMYKLFERILRCVGEVKEIVWLPIGSDSNYAVKGLKKIITAKGERL